MHSWAWLVTCFVGKYFVVYYSTTKSTKILPPPWKKNLYTVHSTPFYIVLTLVSLSYISVTGEPLLLPNFLLVF